MLHNYVQESLRFQAWGGIALFYYMKNRKQKISLEYLLDAAENFSIQEAEKLISAADSIKKEDPLFYKARKAVNILIMAFYHSGIREKQEWATVVFIHDRMEAFVRKIINTQYYAFAQNHYDDMVEVGKLAVLEHMKDFNPMVSDIGSATSFFKAYIQHALNLYVSEFIYQIGEYASRTLYKTKRAQRKLETLGIPLTAQNIACESGLSETQIDTALKAEKFVHQKEKIQEEVPDPLQIIIQKEEKEMLYSALHELSPKHQAYLILAYGLCNKPKLSISGIAKKYGVSPDSVRAEIRKALKALQKYPI